MCSKTFQGSYGGEGLEMKVYVARCRCGYGDLLDYMPRIKTVLKEPFIYCPRCGNRQLWISEGDEKDYAKRDKDGHKIYTEEDIWQ